MSVGTQQNVDEVSFERSLMLRLLKRVGNPRISIRLWRGDEFQATAETPVACVEIRERRALFDMLKSPTVGFGEHYSRGSIEVHGDFLAFARELAGSIRRRRDRRYALGKLRSRLHALRRNSPNRSRHNVYHHYDVGNEFYKLWLDERMVYTCAYYDHPAATLDDAQVAKLDHVCRKLRLEPGQRVIEAGCGWGALALHMAEHYGVDVVAYNHSKEQLDFARQRARAMGLDDRVTFVEDDYRRIDSQCDRFVSVGMLEHVGLANFRTLGALIKRSLKPDGFGLVHSIGRIAPDRPDPWLVKYIFPGGHIPSLAEMMQVFEPHRLSVMDVENLRPHYARTCEAWLRRFDANADRITGMYDTSFTRAWRVYLAYSAAGFTTGGLQLYQVLFTHGTNTDVPWTREYQYADETR